MIENQIVGVDNMIYMSSKSGSDGTYLLTVSLRGGHRSRYRDRERAEPRRAGEPRLPAEVMQTGVSIRKRSANLMMGVVLYGTNANVTGETLTNYATINLLDSIKRVPGVGDASIFALNEYSMNINLDIDRLAALGLTPADVMGALGRRTCRLRSAPSAASRCGRIRCFSLPSRPAGASDAAEFERIIIRADPDGSVIRVGDVARAELGARTDRSGPRLTAVRER